MTKNYFELDRVLTLANAERKLVSALFQLATPAQLENVAFFDSTLLEFEALVAVVSDKTGADKLLSDYKSVSTTLRPLLVQAQLTHLKGWRDFVQHQLDSATNALSFDEEAVLDAQLDCLNAYL